MKCPDLSRVIIIADEPHLAAQTSCALAASGVYVPVIDGPRLGRPDRDAEAIRRNNAVARVHADLIVFAGLSADSRKALETHLPSRRIWYVSTPADVETLRREEDKYRVAPLKWGHDRIGIGLLKALRAGSNIVFEDRPSAIEHVPSESGHLVVCEEGENLSQVIAANYAYALDAGLCIIPDPGKVAMEEILENFYSLHEQRCVSATEMLTRLNDQLRGLCGPLPIPEFGSITFVTRGLPYGIAFPEAPSTHLFTYPDLGISVINGFAAEQPGTPGVNIATLVDPGVEPAPEIEAAIRLLAPRGVFVRGYGGPSANVRDVSEMVDLFPYDILIFATRCGDASGSRLTYEFTDSEGIPRTLVVDVAIGLGAENKDGLLSVTQISRIVSLDGVDWHDPEKSKKLHVGTALIDYIARTGSQSDLQPVIREKIARVVGSAALKMFDHNYIAIPRSLAGERTPIVINNACCSWHELAGRFTFTNARAYIGTLFSVIAPEAHGVTVKLLDKHYGKLLPHALWSAQREVYGNSIRRPYVMTSVYPQRLRATKRNVPLDIARDLSIGLSHWEARLAWISQTPGV